MTAEVNPLLVLQARAEARAILYAAGEYQTVDEATAPLWHFALATDLPTLIGDQGVFEIVQTAFAGVAEL